MSLLIKYLILNPRTAKMCTNPFTVITEYNRKVKHHYMCDYAKKIMSITVTYLTYFPRQGIIQSWDYGLETTITIRDSIP